ncbi:hypothetical protein ACQP2K_03110 [Microbispora siamensis]
MERQPNARLADVVDQAGVSHLGLASRIGQVAKEWRVPVRPSHTQIARWIEGQKPRGITAALIAEALSRKLGRRVTLADIGLEGSTVSPEIGLNFSDVPADLVDTLAQLVNADAQRREFLRSTVDVGALTQAAFGWLLSSPARPPDGSAGRRVGMSDVEAIRSTTAMFADLDNRFGGAHARSAALQYLLDQIVPLLNGTYASAVGRSLFSAVAEFCLSVAWMAYDSGWHGLARRYFLQALSLAHHADDRMLGASVLSAMSHQATYLGEYREALHLARAAQQDLKGRAPALLRAQFAAMEARAAANLPDGAGECLKALDTAARAFSEHRPGEEPEWIAYFDESELADEHAHCFRDMGDARESYRQATHCLSVAEASPAAGGYARSRIFSRIVLATSLVDQGDVEQACNIAVRILPRIQETASIRCTTYLRDLHNRMRSHSDHPSVIDFTEQARPVLRGHQLRAAS